MCGRTACALCKEDLQKACNYLNEKTGKYELPKWGENLNGSREYTPSHNVAPTDVTPVIVPGRNFHDESKRMLQPMMWGMIPPWHKGNYRDHGLSTNNCRFEGLLGSRLYSRPLQRGNRCVVVCDGFYEWHSRGKGPKQPYFIHLPQEDGVKARLREGMVGSGSGYVNNDFFNEKLHLFFDKIRVEDPSTWSNDWDEVTGWKGPKLLHMAGLYDIWKSAEGEEIYSYTVITLDSDDTLFWLHTRMPAILEGQEILDWLDIERVSGKEAFNMLYPMKKPPRSLKWHPVATLMNNSRYKDPSCNKPIKLLNPKKPSGPHEYSLLHWLKRETVKRDMNEMKTEPSETKMVGSSTSVTIKKEEESPIKSELEPSFTAKKMKKEDESPTETDLDNRDEFSFPSFL